jgi:phosphoglucomutase
MSDIRLSPQSERIRLAGANPKSLAEDVSTTELVGERIENILTTAPGNSRPIGGVKVIARSGWFAARPSGTEDIYKIYAESFLDHDHLVEIQKEAPAIIGRVISTSAVPG